MNKKNKKHLRGIVEKYETRGSTDLSLPILKAQQILLNREEVNDLSAILLLSDGEDTCGNTVEKVVADIEKLDKQLQEKK